MTEDEYNSWFKQQVEEALNSEKPHHSHEDVMKRIHAMIDE